MVLLLPGMKVGIPIPSSAPSPVSRYWPLHDVLHRVVAVAERAVAEIEPRRFSFCFKAAKKEYKTAS